MNRNRLPTSSPLGDDARFPAATLLVDAPACFPVGPGFEVVLAPEAIARHAVARLDHVGPGLVGAVFAVGDRCGFFVPSERWATPQWPMAVVYLCVGGCVELPPPHWWRPADASGPGWIRQHPHGRLITPPVILHAALTACSDVLAQIADSSDKPSFCPLLPSQTAVEPGHRTGSLLGMHPGLPGRSEQRAHRSPPCR